MGAKKDPLKCWKTLRAVLPHQGSESGNKWTDGLS
nr:MAG TPA: hypothetical protein [Caudoviricetes sp.]DAT51066.1 MAG TPA: hypothetical protein [Caudoviricetes sp.]